MVTTRPEDLMDRLEAVLPHPDAGATTRRVLEVMGRICGAAVVAAFRERAGMVRYVAGEQLPDRTLRQVRAALRERRGNGRGAIPIGNAAAAGTRAWLFWSGRPHDAELDVVYFEGPALRGHVECSVRLGRLSALLGGLR